MDWDAIVVGGGVAGLVAARSLASDGLRTLVLEARDEPGGAVRGHTVAGLRLDAGAESFATRGGAVKALADELSLPVVAPEPVGSWVHLASGDGPLPRTGLLGIPSQPWSARRTIGVLGALRASLDLVLPRSADPATLGALVRQRMGSRVLDRLVRPVVGGVHAADPDDLSVDAVAPGLAAARSRGSLARAVRSMRASAPAGAAALGIDGGMHLLVDALLADLRARGCEVRTGSTVSTVSPMSPATGAQPSDAGWRVLVTTGSDGPAPESAPRLVLATPGAPELLGLPTGDPDPGAEVTLVTLVLRAPALDHAPRGTGVLVAPEAADVVAKALTHGTAKWAWLAREAGRGTHVVRLSYGRAGAAVTELPDVALALRDASRLLGVPLHDDQLLGSATVRWTQALPRPSEAHRAVVAAVRSAVAELPGVAVCGAWVAGNGLASVVPDARAAARSLV
ncbi:NAD(P)/FAD-dependent oxidoreductase [Cellulomonas sp. URHD0024]|uniref:protoporphyrinogen/coproporphyrinogen oxidase n=1 Tax=Cellulomonas sp. URHD0024 TaxID=1302620 RepID=UPI0004137EB6|nr:FAD-dependent oxidoreductase [Cellulomonas sp. URHD0024]